MPSSSFRSAAWTLAGGALLFAVIATAHGEWEELAKLTASDGAADDWFGNRVALYGDTALIGASLDDDLATDSGSAYVFARIGDAWTQVAKLMADDGAEGDQFGRAVALCGDIALVGAWRDDEMLKFNCGSAYVFQRTESTWTQVAKLTAADGVSGGEFGQAVALYGDTALIGAWHDRDNGTDSGSAYVFKDIDGVWTQATKLTALDGAAGDEFGIAVALFGNTAVITARGDDDQGSNSGSAYVFREIDGVWTQMAKLTAADGEAFDGLGYSAALYGNTALIGSHLDDDQGDDSGSAYVFRENERGWDQVAELKPGDGQVGDNFGHWVALFGHMALIGSLRDDDNGGDSGSAYVFCESERGWEQAAKLKPADGAAGDYFGLSVALSGCVALVGAPCDDDHGNESGSAYVFRMTAPDVEDEFFDDFTSYSDCNDPDLDGWWQVRHGEGGPGHQDATWDRSLVTFAEDPELPGNMLVQLHAQTAGTPQTCKQSEIDTQGCWFFEGTYAARARFTDEWRQAPPQPSVQAFFAINEYPECDPDYSECDFEYLPNDDWFGGCSAPALHVTTWELWSDPNTADPDCDDLPDRISTPQCGSLADWRIYVFQVIDGNVFYWVEDDIVDYHDAEFYPDQPMRISFSHWFWFREGLGSIGDPVDYAMEVDWVYHAKDVALDWRQVESVALHYRSTDDDGRVNTMPGGAGPNVTGDGAPVDPTGIQPVPPP